jgi:predicted DNA-binding protein with PD1-like motif
MASSVSTEFPRPRMLIHPGTSNPVRIQSRHCLRARHIRLALQPGLTLFDALVRPLAEIGVHNASTTILGGVFSELQFCVAPPDPSGRAVIAYTRPMAAGRCTLVFGNATVGKDTRGEPLVHCHAALRTEAGDVKGGHIVPHLCVIGPQPIPVLVTSLEGFELRVTFDPETNIPLLQPHAEVPHA